MPINLEQMAAAAKQGKNYDAGTRIQSFTPKFFSNKLTGSGKKNGILCYAADPARISNIPITTGDHTCTKKMSYQNGDTQAVHLPFYVMTPAQWNLMEEIPMPDRARLAKIASLPQGSPADPDWSLYVAFLPHSIILETTSVLDGSGTSSTVRKTAACYQVAFFREGGAPGDPAYAAEKASLPQGSPGNRFWNDFTCDPGSSVQGVLDLAESAGWDVDHAAAARYLDDYSLYGGICERSMEWQTTIHKMLDCVFRNVATHHYDTNALNAVAMILRHLEDYGVPLDLYREIYKSVQAHFKPKHREILYRQNLNLLLSDQLNALDRNRANLTCVPPVAAGNPLPAMPGGAGYSREQINAIASPDPLTLVQSGAGTGKAMPYSTPVLTPDGWKPIGDLWVNDLVIGSDGKPHRVLRVHERGVRNGYNLVFNDGASVPCCSEHLWTVKSLRDGTERTVTTDEWLSCIYDPGNHVLPAVAPVEYAEPASPLPLDPYLMGVLLAAGHVMLKPVRVSIPDPEVLREAERAAGRMGLVLVPDPRQPGKAVYQLARKPGTPSDGERALRKALSDLKPGMSMGMRSIPARYAFAPIEDRRALLSGIFDACGYVDGWENRPVARVRGKIFAEHIRNMLWSLGLQAEIREGPARASGRDGCIVILRDNSWNPFKASPAREKFEDTAPAIPRFLLRAEPIEPCPMRCIEVDAPDHLYVTKDFLVTHNSTVILGRVDYMIAAGVRPEDIMVLSFTNAAADHIAEKNPRIHSMTIASMIHSIYALNFPNHELSSVDTMINALDIYYKDDPLVAKFQKMLLALRKNANRAYTDMNNFIEAYRPQVLDILGTVKQTSLELEIILCYQLIDKLQEPPEIRSRFLIIDEVQDNSIFEFVYAIKYVVKHLESLYIVGKLRLPTLNPINCGKAACA